MRYRQKRESLHSITFCAGVKVINLEKHFAPQGENSYWSVCVNYIQSAQANNSNKKAKVDYREVLSEIDFSLFAQLRELRKQLANAEGVPIYAIFTNEQLADCAIKKPNTKTGLQQIEGIGQARVNKYGDRIIEKINLFAAQTTFNSRLEWVLSHSLSQHKGPPLLVANTIAKAAAVSAF